MGPRPNGRGKLAASCTPRAASGVNGAAAKRPRKDRQANKAAGHRHASMGPRPNGRGKRLASGVVIDHVQRQWGRGQTAAESGIAAAQLHCLDLRQWGRGQTAAERMPPRPASCAASSVNGAAAKRPRKAARPPANTWRGTFRVNGAAAKRPRKGPIRAGAGRTGFTSVNGAAAKRPRKAVEIHRVLKPTGSASMGPRPNGRGKFDRRMSGRAGLERQWGRGQTAAESGA